MLVITMWFLTWVIVEFEEGSSRPNLIWRMLFSCVTDHQPESPRFWKLNECIAVSGNIKDLIERVRFFHSTAGRVGSPRVLILTIR
jgi:hypothetical protein